MGLIKKLCNIIIVTVITTLTACKVQEVYNRYAYNDIAKAELKRKIKGLNPFNKESRA